MNLYIRMRLTYDRNRYHDQDLESTLGFFLALQSTLRIRKGGLLFLGVPCSSFTWVSASRHKRKFENPHGDLGQSFVVAGNKICTRAVLLVMVMLVRAGFYFIENPMRSAIVHYPYIRYLLQLQNLDCHFLETRITRWCPCCNLTCIRHEHVTSLGTCTCTHSQAAPPHEVDGSLSPLVS